jgi:hypothetical protein
MKSRFLVGLTLLAAVGATIGGTAAAQRFERIRELMQQRAHRPTPTPRRSPRQAITGSASSMAGSHANI